KLERSIGGGNGPGGRSFDWSPDGKSIAFAHTRTPRADDWPTADVSVVDVASGEVRPLSATAGCEESPRFSRDGRTVAFMLAESRVRWGGAHRIALVPAAGGAARTLAPTFDEQPVPIDFSSDGSKLFYTEAHGTTSVIGAAPVDGGAPIEIGRVDGTLSDVRANLTGTRLGFTAEAPDRPQEGFLTPADRFAPAPVTSANAAAPRHPFGKTDVVSWKSKDGLPIEGLLTLPSGAGAGSRVPLLLVVHGGPTGVFTRTFTASP